MQGISSILWRRKKLLLLAAIGAGGYCYYRSDSFQRRKKQVILLIHAMSNLFDSALAIADSAAIVSTELRDFLTSDDPRPPRSLRQVFKLLQCPEFQDLLAATSSSVCREILPFTPAPRRSKAKNLEIFDSSSKPRRRSDQPGLPERLLSKLLSEQGKGFASAVVGSAVRNLVLTVMEQRSSDEEENSGDSVFELGPSGVVRSSSSSSRSRGGSELGEKLFSLASSSRGRALIGDCIQQFVEASVSTYLEKTKDVNIFEDFVEAVTMPDHEQQAKEIIVSVCNGAVDTLVRTSYQVLASDDSSSRGGGENENGKNSGIGDVAEKVFQVAAVPGNRELLVEIAGRVSSEAVKSLLQVVHWEISGVKERMIGEAGVKALVLVTLCMAVFLHLLTRTWLG